MLSVFPFYDKIYQNFSEFDLEVMWRIKLFPLKTVKENMFLKIERQTIKKKKKDISEERS